MGKKLWLFALTGVALCALAGCKGEEGNYYTIDVYSDYEGMEADLETLGTYRKESATKVGVCYALKNKKANVGGIQSYKDSSGKDYSYRNSRRVPLKGHSYKFKELKGFYEASKPIDLNEITANCAIFATFDLTPRTYLVSVKDAYKGDYKDFGEFLAFGTKVQDNEKLSEALLDFPVHDPSADPEDPGTWRDPYYADYKPVGWNVYEYDDEGTVVTYPGKEYTDDQGKPVTDFLAYDAVDAIKAFAIQGKTTFAPKYDDSAKKKYEVTISYQLRTLTGYELSGKALYAYADLPGAETLPQKKTVEYGKGLDLSGEDFKLASYKVIGNGKDGNPDRYDLTDPMLPPVLKEAYKDGTGETKYRGVAIDFDSIRYNCAITLLYERDISYTVKFHNDPTNPSDPAVSVKVQALTDATAPDLVSTPAGYVFADEWTKTKGSTETYSLEKIGEDVDLYPILIPEKIVNASNLEFTADLDHHGYKLTNVENVVANYVLNEEKFAAEFPERFPFNSIETFGDAKKSITSVTLPADVHYADHGMFALLENVVTLNLKKSKLETLPAYSFQNLSALTTISLPSTLQTVGTEQFRNCTSLTTIEIDLTEAEVAERDFADHWASGKTVTYKAAA
ncbi:MAG: leucine-rich repeat domain-containing protein [Bacilli bacterium]|nr:leucine-rich repeat domain-containing protein [Bacilli bacterium]